MPESDARSVLCPIQPEVDKTSNGTSGSTDCRRDQEEGSELDSQEELDAFAGPGEIK